MAKNPSHRSSHDPERRSERSTSAGGPLETLFQEALRRAAAVGISGFAFTEEAIRRAMSESPPPQVVSYLGQQSVEVRDEIIERLAREFGTWLHDLDLPKLAAEVLEETDVVFEVRVKARPKSREDAE